MLQFNFDMIDIITSFDVLFKGKEILFQLKLKVVFFWVGIYRFELPIFCITITFSFLAFGSFDKCAGNPRSTVLQEI